MRQPPLLHGAILAGGKVEQPAVWSPGDKSDKKRHANTTSRLPARMPEHGYARKPRLKPLKCENRPQNVGDGLSIRVSENVMMFGRKPAKGTDNGYRGVNQRSDTTLPGVVDRGRGAA